MATIYLYPSQIEAFTITTSDGRTFTNESETASRTTQKWAVEIENASGEDIVVTVSAEGYYTLSKTIASSATNEYITIVPKRLYAWTGDGITIYTPTENPTTDTIFCTDFLDKYGTPINEEGGIYIGSSTVTSADSSSISLNCYYEPV